MLSATNGATISVQPPPFSGGTISVVVTDSKCGRTISKFATVNRSIPPLGAISGGAGCFCAGQTQTFSVPAVNGATSYQWIASGSLTIMGGQGTTSVSIGTNGSGGTLSCTAVTPCGNTNTVKSNDIATSSVPPETPNITVISTPCTQYRVAGQIAVTNIDPCATYYWSGDAGMDIGNFSSSVAVSVPTSGLRAYVYGINACGMSATGSRTVPATSNCGGYFRMASPSISAAPNPFNDRTTLSYTLPDDVHVSIEVTTPIGNRITTLVNGRQSSGNHEVVFDASRLPVGVYIATMTTTAKSGDRQTKSVQLTLSR